MPSYNRAFLGQYAPGSTFKIVTPAALLGTGMTPNSPTTCTNTINVFGKTSKNYDALAPRAACCSGRSSSPATPR